ncbi:hypothetical protein JL722_12717 [Aureococcus anophagefferens]|nr:hypothetical protein JL722_12717 [Aureococcus anophagefferens]
MTPHESLPLKGGGRRQYFRLVVGEAMARAGLEHRLDFFAACGVRRFADLRDKGAELRRGLDHWDQTRLRYALKKPGVLWFETAPDSGEE